MATISLAAAPEFSGQRQDFARWCAQFKAHMRVYHSINLDAEGDVDDAKWLIVRDQLIMVLPRSLFKTVKGEVSGRRMWTKIVEKYKRGGLLQMQHVKDKLEQMVLKKHAGMEGYLSDKMECFEMLKANKIELNSVEKILSLLKGLGPEYDTIREQVDEQFSPDNDEAANEALLASCVERLKRRARLLKANGTESTVQTRAAMTTVKTSTKGVGSRKKAQVRTCWTCGKPGHIAANCRSNSDRGARGPQQNRAGCFICGEKGHTLRYCKYNTFQASAAQSETSIEVKPREREEGSWGVGGFATSIEMATAYDIQFEISSFLLDDEDQEEQEEVTTGASYAAVSSISDSSIEKPRDMIADSGCGMHMTPHADELMACEPCKGSVVLANSERIPIVGVGRKTLWLDDKTDVGKSVSVDYPCFLVPQLVRPLFSIGEFTRATGTEISFRSGKLVIKAPEGELAVEGRNNIFMIPHREHLAMGAALSLKRWHHRLGHCSYEYARQALNEGNVVFDPGSSDGKCDICLIANMKRFPFPRESHNRSTDNLDLVAVDLFGPLPSSVNGNIHGIVYTDDATRMSYFYPLKRKSDATDTLKLFCADVGKMKKLRMDCAEHLIAGTFEELRVDLGIGRDESTPYCPQQNSIVETRIRLSHEIMRAIMKWAMMEDEWWEYAMATAVYIMNRLPTKANGMMSPISKWTGKRPRLDHLRTFGCKCVARIPPERRPTPKKLADRGAEAVFLGYSVRQKSYIVVLVDDMTITTSRSVEFYEEIPGGPLLKSGEYSDDEDFPEESETDDSEARGTDEVLDTIDALPESSSTSTEGSTRYVRRNRKKPSKYWVAAMAWHQDMAQALSALHEEYEPQTFEEAVSHPTDGGEWRRAIKEELRNHQANKTFKVIPDQPNRNKVSLKWVFARKRNALGQVVRYKARLVARGFSQRYGVDYDKTYAPVISMTVFRVLCAIAVKHDLQLFQVDVTAAYLHAELDELIVVQTPPGMEVPKDMSVALQKALYGLKQSGRKWKELITRWLCENGFVHLDSDPCVFVNQQDSIAIGMIIGVYVDDICGAAKSAAQWKTFVEKLAEAFPIKEGELGLYLNIVCARVGREITLHQQQYTLQLLKRYGMDECRTVTTPMDSLLVDTSGEDAVDEKAYRTLVGSLQWLANSTRPDIAWAVNQLAKYSSSPTHTHQLAAKRVLRYLAGTSSLGIKFSGDADNSDLHCFVDSDFAGDIETRRSTYGYIVFLAGGPVSWRSKRQECVTLSSTEAEYIGISEAGKQVKFLRLLLREMNMLPEGMQSVIFNDNRNAVSMTNDDESFRKTKHIEVRFRWIQEAIRNKMMNVAWVPAKEMVADILTKAVKRQVFEELRDKIMTKV